MSTLLPDLERELLFAAERTQPVAAPARRRRSRRAHRRLMPVVVAVVLLTLTAAALAATGVIPIGSPVPASNHRPNPKRGAGAMAPGTAKVLPIRVADPDGGPDWGMRLQATTRGAVCIQTARVVDGMLGVLGQNGAFGDDGRFHPLPSRVESFGCGALDARGGSSFAMTLSAVPANASIGGFLGVNLPRCKPASCPTRDRRDIYIGLLGRDAETVTYEGEDGALHSVPTTAPYGAYLLVRRTQARGGSSMGIGAYPGAIVRRITFRDGRSCTFPAPASGARAKPCAPLTPRPAHTHAQVATPIHVRAVRRLGRSWRITVSFRAPVAITTASQAYTILFRNPEATNQGYRYSVAEIQDETAAGSLVTKRYFKSEPGTYTGEVRLATTATAGIVTGTRDGALVGRFKVRIP